jgi:hypothetical protein
VNYKVIVADSVTGFLRGLPRAVRVQVYERLFVELPANPDAQLGPQLVPFAHKHTFSVTIVDTSQRPPLGWWFLFVGDRGTSGELHVESVRDANESNPN